MLESPASRPRLRSRTEDAGGTKPETGRTLVFSILDDPMQGSNLLLVCDLDGTLIPTRPAPGSCARFARFAADRRGWELAYATGRHRSLAEEGILSHALPDPDWLICNVGTTLLGRAERGDVTGERSRSPDREYRTALRKRMGGADPARVRARLDGFADLHLQEEARQGEFKTSYAIPRGADIARLREAVREVLGKEVTQIWSEDPVTGEGLLDLLPAGVTKAHAVDHLRRSRGIPLERVLYAGDSGNDRAALLMGCLGILVGNAPDSLRRELDREARELGLRGSLHFATRPFADGVLEGVRHFGFPRPEGGGSRKGEEAPPTL